MNDDCKENDENKGIEKKKFFSTPVVKLHRNISTKSGFRRKNTTHQVANASSMMYKQSLKANNKSLAKALDFSKQDVALLSKRVLELEQEKQEQAAKISVLRKLTEDSNEAVESEIQRRMEMRLERFKRKLESAARCLHLAGDELHDVIGMCDMYQRQDIDTVVKDTLELTQMCTPDNFNHHLVAPRSIYDQVASSESANDLKLEEELGADFEDAVESRLSIVDETAERKRKSSLRRGSITTEDPPRMSLTSDDGSAVSNTRSKRRTLRNSQVTNHSTENATDITSGDTADESGTSSQEEPRRSFVASRSKRRRTRKSTAAIQPLETVISAAVPPQSPPPSNTTVQPVNSPQHIEEIPCHTPEPSAAGTQSEKTTPNISPAPYVPYDEIPVGSKAAREEAVKQAAVSRSRRQTQIIKPSQHSVDETAELLEKASGKFYIQLSPAKIFNDQKSQKTEESLPLARRSRRGTYCIKSHEFTDEPITGIEDENDSLLLDDSDYQPYPMEMTADEERMPLSVPQSPDMMLTPKQCEPEEDYEAEADASDEQEVTEKRTKHRSSNKKVGDNSEGPVRLMEIKCKGGQVKVTLKNQNETTAKRTKERKKKQEAVALAHPSSQFDFAGTPPTRDPFDLSLSDTLVGERVSSKEFHEKQKALAQEIALMNRKAKSKQKDTSKTSKSRKKKKESDTEDEEDDAYQPKLKSSRLSKRQQPNYITDDDMDDDLASVCSNDSETMSRARKSKKTKTKTTAQTKTKSKAEVEEAASPDVEIEADPDQEENEGSGIKVTKKKTKKTKATVAENLSDSQTGTHEDMTSQNHTDVGRPTTSETTEQNNTQTLTDEEVFDDKKKDDQEVKTEVDQKTESSPPRRARRAAASICFKEPGLNAKLRRGDPGTSTLYGDVDIYANTKTKGKKKT